MSIQDANTPAHLSDQPQTQLTHCGSEKWYEKTLSDMENSRIESLPKWLAVSYNNNVL
ncbi:hypothetical protein CY34DRAFT_809756 [Suillus luteus UH-Slu-Lm8-n1]|uniref:Uncharacterized protein n=1 Tax=Suillus luteus UH-Slu-Lm8-n1 TaxID=930992 RepID=A0A0D0AUP1_9AGAM|nr:hypothetical protein CY34DRAFT_809756 [Suillus luteus UH-Slu-Lm8-n1]